MEQNIAPFDKITNNFNTLLNQLDYYQDLIELQQSGLTQEELIEEVKLTIKEYWETFKSTIHEQN